MNCPISCTATARTKGSRAELSRAISCLERRDQASDESQDLRTTDYSLNDLSLVLEPYLFHVLLPKVFRLVRRRPAEMPTLDFGCVLVKRSVNAADKRTWTRRTGKETYVRFSRRPSSSSFKYLMSSTTSSSDHFLVENDLTSGRSFCTSIAFRLELGARLSRFWDVVF